jgi:hypothetical protein
MGVSCRTHGEEEKLLIGKPKGNIYLIDLSVDGKIILKLLLEK